MVILRGEDKQLTRSQETVNAQQTGTDRHKRRNCIEHPHKDSKKDDKRNTDRQNCGKRREWIDRTTRRWKTDSGQK